MTRSFPTTQSFPTTLAPRQPAAIVKLGGSLFAGAGFDRLLAVAASHGALVVAGGGPFADAVRTAQGLLGFDDPAAHRMAILAMEQAAHFVTSRRPDVSPCASLDEIAAATASRRPAVWLPASMASAADLPASWDVTSDSLALWLALQTGARRVALVKSAAVPDSSGAAEWVAAGLVDPHLPVVAAGFRGDLLCIGEASADALDAALAAPERIAA